MANIFISYAREDRPKALELARAFEGRGWSVWWDTRLKAGEVWDEVIERELTAAQCVVVLWSRTSIRKRWVRVEATEGLQRRILIPVLIEDVRPPLAFRMVQAELLADWFGDHSHSGLLRLLAAIDDRLGDHKHDEPVNPEITNLSVFRDVEAPWCPEMVVIPAGKFLMGSAESEEDHFNWEGPQHEVTIGRRLALGRYAVTFGEYDHFCAATQRKQLTDQGWGRGTRPVINVSWWDAAAYCEWLAKETGQPYRLPSEAEWEYACRAGTTTRYAWGDAITPKNANYAESKIGKTTEVGQYPASPWNLYDMHGNVWEWIEDVWHDSYKGAPSDGSAWTDGEGEQSPRIRVIRGGSWSFNPWNLRSAYRCRVGPVIRSIIHGFRVARTLS